MSLSTALLLTIAAFLGGTVNAIAGGGSFISFPALLFAGIPPVAANATNTVALLPGAVTSVWAYRRDFERVAGLSVAWITAISLIGGAAGAALLLMTPESTFASLIPWLLLAATLIFAFGRQVAAWARSHFRIGRTAVLTMQLAISTYGGYFGGGIGILMLATFSIFGMTRLNAMNALKTWLAAWLNGIAALLFILNGRIYWREAIIMMAASTIGGYAGAAAARKVDARIMRAVIISIGLALSAYFFVK